MKWLGIVLLGKGVSSEWVLETNKEELVFVDKGVITCEGLLFDIILEWVVLADWKGLNVSNIVGIEWVSNVTVKGRILTTGLRVELLVGKWTKSKLWLGLFDLEDTDVLVLAQVNKEILFHQK